MPFLAPISGFSILDSGQQEKTFSKNLKLFIEVFYSYRFNA